MPVHTYTNWNSRPSDREEQVEPYRKYYFICEGANTETFYFEKLIDLRKDLGIHPLIDIRLWEKTEGDRNISFAKNLVRFAYEQKSLESNGFDVERDKMIIVDQSQKSLLKQYWAKSAKKCGEKKPRLCNKVSSLLCNVWYPTPK